jgi:photosystem II stability/assembly factor-like uncharacterized protein
MECLSLRKIAAVGVCPLMLLLLGACNKKSAQDTGPFLLVRLSVPESFPTPEVASAEIRIRPPPGGAPLNLANVRSFGDLHGVPVMLQTYQDTDGATGLLVSVAGNPFQGVRADIYLYPRLKPSAGGSESPLAQQSPPVQVDARLYIPDGRLLGNGQATQDLDGQPIRLGQSDRSVQVLISCPAGGCPQGQLVPPTTGVAQVRVFRDPGCQIPGSSGDLYVFLAPTGSGAAGKTVALPNANLSGGAPAILEIKDLAPGPYLGFAVYNLSHDLVTRGFTPNFGDLLSTVGEVDIFGGRLTSVDLFLIEAVGPGRCASSPACQSTDECTGGLVCLNSNCVSCTADAQCTNGRVCTNGSCQAPSGCTSNDQCGSLVCVNRACVPCTSTTQCTSGLMCVGGSCQTGGGGCSPACTGGTVCNGQFCTSCTSPDQCVSGQDCTQGRCQVSFTSLTASPMLAGNGIPVTFTLTASRALVLSPPPTLTINGNNAQLTDSSQNPVLQFQYVPNSSTDFGGDQSILVSGSDGVGAVASKTFSGVVTFDFEQPSGTITIMGTMIGSTKYLGSKSLSVTIDPSFNATEMSIYEGQGGSAAYGPVMTNLTYNYTGADGPVTLCLKLRTAAQNVSDEVCDTVTVDTTPPTVPGGVTISGTRLASLQWTASTDTGSGGVAYKIYYGASAATYDGTIAVEGPSPVRVTAPNGTLSNLSFGGNTYHVAVSAVDAIGNESMKSPDQTVTTTAQPYQWVFPGYGPGNVWRLQCLDQNTCFVAARGSASADAFDQVGNPPNNRGGLSKTTDGFATWTLLDTGSANPVRALAMKDANVGLIGLDEQAVIRRTDDGGKSWSIIRYADPQHSATDLAYDIKWIDPANSDDVAVVVYRFDSALRHILYLSHDAGLTFTNVEMTTMGSSISGFEDGILQVQDPTPGAEKLITNLARQSTGGSVYTNHTPGLSMLGNWDVVLTGGFWDVQFRSPTDGIIVGIEDKALYYDGSVWTQATFTTCGTSNRWFHALSYPPAPATLAWTGSWGQLCQSTDSGQTWTAVSTSYSRKPNLLNSGSSIHAIHFFSDTDGVMALNDSSLPTLLRTTNGGTSWSLLQPSIGHDTPNPIKFALSFWLDEQHGWVGDTDGPNYYRTTDGGATWTPLNTGGTCNQGGSFTFIKFFDTQKGISSHCTTIDGGLTWTALPTSATANHAWTPNAVDWPAANEIYLAGSNRASYSFDGGATWTQFQSITGLDQGILSIVRTTLPAPDGRQVVYIGSGGQGQLWRSVFNSSNSTYGNWAQIGQPNTIPDWTRSCCNDFSRVLFPSRGATGFIVSFVHASVLKTTDGGTTWSEVNTAFRDQWPSYRINDVSCVDDLNCTFLALGLGEVWTTSDGFQTSRMMTQNCSGVMQNSKNIYAFPGGTEILVGQTQIMKTHSRWE